MLSFTLNKLIESGQINNNTDRNFLPFPESEINQNLCHKKDAQGPIKLFSLEEMSDEKKTHQDSDAGKVHGDTQANKACVAEHARERENNQAEVPKAGEFRFFFEISIQEVNRKKIGQRTPECERLINPGINLHELTAAVRKAGRSNKFIPIDHGMYWAELFSFSRTSTMVTQARLP
jgi:hypothetical protein